jgi:O-antigen/teichoic acid export membrane protein
MLRTGLALTGANILIALLGLARNILIARLIGVEDFGIASTFAITAAFIEMTSNVGIDRLIVQAKDGDEPELQATAQAIQVVRGIVGALVLLAISGPLANFFGVGEITWAYQLMAFVPLLRGFVHLDMFRYQRRMKFQASAGTELAAMFVSTLAAIPAAIYMADFRAMLLAIILQQMLYLIASHIAAQRAYAWNWNRNFRSRAFHFGWPLIVNNYLLYFILQGDRIIVANQYGMEKLGIISAGVTLTLNPSLVLARTLSTLILPILSKSDIKLHNFFSIINFSWIIVLLFGFLMTLIYIFFGGKIINILYGAQFDSVSYLLPILALAHSIRICRVIPNNVALSRGNTHNTLYSNMVRFSFVCFAYISAVNGFTIIDILFIAAIGESFALFVASIFIYKYYKNTSLLSIIFSILSFIIIIVFYYLFNEKMMII